MSDDDDDQAKWRNPKDWEPNLKMLDDEQSYWKKSESDKAAENIKSIEKTRKVITDHLGTPAKSRRSTLYESE